MRTRSHTFEYIKNLSTHHFSISIHFHVGFLDGATHNSYCGSNGWFRLCNRKQYTLSWNDGTSTHSRENTMAFFGLLWFVNRHHVNNIHIYGDSRSLIEGLLGHTNFSPPHLSCWIDYLRLLLHTL